jgi:hypothetical protein
LQVVKRSANAVHIGVLAFNAPFVARPSNPFSASLIAAIEPDFIQQFLAGSKEVCLFAFFEEFLMLLGAVSQKETTAGWYFKGPRSVLIGTDLPQQTKPNL